MCEQMTMFPPLTDGENAEEIRHQAEVFREYAEKKRHWENRFQKWSDEHGMEQNNTTSYGCCGYGSMCDWCKDNSYGRPCVRALNVMLREKHLTIDYSDCDFESVWLM